MNVMQYFRISKFLGRGVVYGYDPVGCMEKLGHAAGGSGVAIMAPLLDNQVEKLNMVDPKTGLKMEKKRPTLEEGKYLSKYQNWENATIKLKKL